MSPFSPIGQEPPARKTMRVAVTLTVEVDPEAWEAAYGVSGSRQIRDDVRIYIRGQVQNSAAADEGGIQSVSFR